MSSDLINQLAQNTTHSALPDRGNIYTYKCSSLLLNAKERRGTHLQHRRTYGAKRFNSKSHVLCIRGGSARMQTMPLQSGTLVLIMHWKYRVQRGQIIGDTKILHTTAFQTIMCVTIFKNAEQRQKTLTPGSAILALAHKHKNEKQKRERTKEIGRGNIREKRKDTVKVRRA